MCNKEEFLRKYGHILVKFRSYYRYLFTFEGATTDGCRVVVDCCGDASSVVDFFVDAYLESPVFVFDSVLKSAEVFDPSGASIVYFNLP